MKDIAAAVLAGRDELVEQLPAEVRVVSVVGGLAPQPVNDGDITPLFELLLDAPDLSGAVLEESGRLG